MTARMLVLLVAICLSPGLVFSMQDKLDAYPASNVAVTLPDGFKITQIAADDVASNIFSMTVDDLDRPVVSGPGYIRTLIDDDGDNVFESFKQFSDGPATGAQGLLFLDDSLLCTGDGGLLRYMDVDRDGVADGPPELLVELKTGGEHTAHAIRLGLDGNYYLIAGNHTDIPDSESRNSLRDECPNAHAGFLMRISPDFKHSDIVLSGFRNAYDFDINLDGEFIVYDSDGERDVSLPWYRPTRVFRMRPGDDAGWVSEGWKRPSRYYDMPETIADTGRGSPTGVCTCLTPDFGAEYLEAVFVADWTFGRIRVIKRDLETGDYLPVENLATPTGTLGFAVTDLEMDSRGSLLISVGGRGTKGGVYRIERTAESHARVEPEARELMQQRLMPLSDIIMATGMHGPFEPARIRELESEGASQREVNLMISLSARNGLSFELLDLIIERLSLPTAELDNTRKQRAMLSLLIGRKLEMDDSQSLKLVTALSLSAIQIDKTRNDRDIELWVRACRSLPDSARERLMQQSIPLNLLAALEIDALDQKQRIEVDRTDAHAELAARLTGELRNTPSDQLAMWLRQVQKALGPFDGRGPGPPVNVAVTLPYHLSVFHGYVTRLPRGKIPDGQENALRLCWAAIETGSEDHQVKRELKRELLRVVALGGNCSQAMARLITHELTGDSPVAGDVHCLSVLALSLQEFEKPEAEKIGAAIVRLRAKIANQNLNEDRNWVPRVGKVCAILMEQPAVALAVAGGETFADQGNEFLLAELPAAIQDNARQKIVDRVSDMPLDKVSGSHLKLFLREPGCREWLRSLCDDLRLREAAVRAIAGNHIAGDEPFLVDALEYGNSTTLLKVARRLLRIESTNEPEREVVLAWNAARRLGTTGAELKTRDTLMQLVELRTAGEFGYQAEKEGELQIEAFAKSEAWLQEHYTGTFQTLVGDSKRNSIDTFARLEAIDWNSGDALRGAEVFRAASCIKCHNGGNRMGPSLEGVTSRFAVDDLFTAIIDPDNQVSEQFRAVVVSTEDGEVFRGIKIYESVDGITLGDTRGETIRINRDNIEQMADSKLSAMPSRLIDEMRDQAWADLYAYLKTL